MEDQNPLIVAFHAEARSIRDAVDARFEGVHLTMTEMSKVLDRVVTAVEKQNEINTNVAVLAANLAHQQADHAAFQTRVETTFRTFDEKVNGVIEHVATLVQDNKVEGAKKKIVAGAVIATVSAVTAFATSNFPVILHLLGMA